MSIITTCRLCMQENVIVTSFYLSENTNQCFIRLLLTCAPVQVEDYNLSNLVCQLCKQELYRFGKFIKLLEKSNMFLGDNISQENDEEFERITVNEDNKNSIFIKESMSELELNDTQIGEFEIAMDEIKTEIEDQVEENFELTDLQKTGEMLVLSQTELMAPKKKLTRKETLEKKRAAERLRYQRLKNDPEKYFQQKDKKKQNYQRQKEEGHIKTVNQMTPSERAEARKRWRERSKLYYHRKVLRGTNKLRVNAGSPPQEKQSHDCEICGKKFMSRAGLRLHVPRHKDNKSIECEICLKRFPLKKWFDEHMMAHSMEKPFPCEICKRRFRQKPVLRKHLRTHMSKCHICRKRFPTASALEEHMMEHITDATFTCDICSEQFETGSLLKKHQSIHSTEQPFMCDICGKTFTYPYMLKEHLRIHSGERPFKCDVCFKSFTHKSKLKVHIKVHSGENRYACEVCGKSFAQRSHLKPHMLNHAEEKPFKCNVCFKEFTTNTKLDVHTRTHTGERPYKCTICWKSFSQKSHLKQHMLCHSEEKLFNCDVCSKSFSLKRTLELHISKNH